MMYSIKELSIDGEANPRFGELSSSEKPKKNGHYRVVGGDQGDVYFDGYEVINGKTVLINPELYSGHEDLTEDDEPEPQRITLYG